MEYAITFENENYELPAFNFNIDEKLNEIQNSKNLKDRCKKIFNFLESDIFDKAKVKDMFGSFNDCDPNRLELLFLAINNSYRQPVQDEQIDYIQNRIESAGIDKFGTLGDLIEKFEKINK